VVKGQGPEGGGVFGTLGQRTSIQIDVVGGAQDEDALARLQKVNKKFHPGGGPCIDMPVVLIPLYAQAAAGPE